MACKDCADKSSKAAAVNPSLVTFDLLNGELGLSADDATYLVELGVRATPEDDALSVLGVALVASLERAKDLQTTLDQRTMALEEAEAEYERLEEDYNNLTESVEGLHSRVSTDDSEE